MPKYYAQDGTLRNSNETRISGPLPIRLFLSILFRRTMCPECGISHTQCLRFTHPSSLLMACVSLVGMMIPLGMCIHDITVISGWQKFIFVGLFVLLTGMLGLSGWMVYTTIGCKTVE